MLNVFGQTFKDNGYQLMNDRDSPIWQNPSYWPVTFRMTPNWHRESTSQVAIDTPNGGQIPEEVTNNGFDLSGLDFHTGGTLYKNYSFYLLPSSDATGAFHFETVMARIDNLGNSPGSTSSWASSSWTTSFLKNASLRCPITAGLPALPLHSPGRQQRVWPNGRQPVRYRVDGSLP